MCHARRPADSSPRRTVIKNARNLLTTKKDSLVLFRSRFAPPTPQLTVEFQIVYCVPPTTQNSSSTAHFWNPTSYAGSESHASRPSPLCAGIWTQLRLIYLQRLAVCDTLFLSLSWLTFWQEHRTSPEKS
ncbi:hypothetical protein M404DRAFT_809014 [Pisolithus tinctorius Marx 270]|uniref:Uncharacterized protein n=1 Tax=Pisolithus tinctorius Marx 270 TaxID=870435 RepID=A0A0C3NWQ8_PISTI|nr:hypothetical protein M404DRAFT_809014 [Pisolithus tinctorius Marx 270]